MGRQIVKQPNGNYALWSSVVDDFVLVDASPAEIIEEFCEEDRKRVEKHVTETVALLDAGKEPYCQFTKTFTECVAIVRDLHGDDAESLKMLGIRWLTH